MHIESDLVKSFVIEDISSVEDKGGLDHGVIDSFIIQLNIERPFREDGNCMSIFCRCIGIRLKGYTFCQFSQVHARIFERVWIGDDDVGAFFQ